MRLREKTMFKDIQNLNINFDNQKIKLFNDFSSFFIDYNSKVNLISNNDSKFLYEKHIYDSLAFNLFYEKYCKNGNINLLDIGTGGGFPSLPIALYYKNINVTAVDSINKKIDFIKTAADNFSIRNINPIVSRIEELNQSYRESFDIVTTRALARLNIILEYAIPFLKKGGYFIAYKSKKAQEEIKEAQNALKLLNANIVDQIEYSLPLNEDNKRILIVIKKAEKTKPVYPRRNGVIKKNPL